MTDQESRSSQAPRVLKAVPVTPSAQSHRPEGLAFDVEEDADLSGVPTGDQRPANPDAENTERQVHESGEGVGLAVPTDQDRSAGTSGGK